MFTTASCIKLSHNSANSFPDFSMLANNQFAIIHLDNNRIKSISNEYISTLVRLEELTLDHNYIDALPHKEFCIPQLVHFPLHNNLLLDLSPMIATVGIQWKLISWDISYNNLTTTVYPKKYAHGFCFAVLCCGYILTDFPISIRLTSLALLQSNDCPSASKATLMNMDKYFMWIHYERLHNHNKAKHNKTVCIFLGIYCIPKRLLLQLTSLEYLNASCNLIEEMPYLTAVAAKIISVNLSHNHIRSIPAAYMNNLLSLEHLDLQGNLLNEFPFWTLKMSTSLDYLNLQHNILSTLPANYPELKLSDTAVVDIRQNPLFCDKTLCWMRHYKPLVLLRDLTPCITPRSLVGAVFNDLTDSQLQCLCKCVVLLWSVLIFVYVA